MSYNIEGFNRNKFYLAKLVNKYSPIFIFIQEHWLPYHDAESKLSKDFSNYSFLVTSSDMFIHPEDKILQNGPIWHGKALGWKKELDGQIVKLPVVSERFCCIRYNDKNNTKILAI